MWKYPALFLLVCNTALAQPTSGRVVLLHYALDSFYTGRVLLKNGTSSPQTLNYNTLTNEMIFVSAGRYMAIANPQEVDTVFIAQHQFVPIAGKFCEWLGGVQPALFKEYTCSVKEPEAQAGFGKTNVSAASALNTLVHSGGAYNLSLPLDFDLVPGVMYYLRSKGKMYKLTNAKQVAKTIAAKKDAVEAWLKTGPSKFSTEEEMIRFVKSIQE